VVAGAGATYVGTAEPYLSRATIPGPEWVPVAAAVVAGVLGWGVVRLLETRSWVSAGRRADLTAGGGGILRKPGLTGTVQGRPVRGYIRRKSTGGGQGSSKRTFTVVEADLGGDAETGRILVRKDGPELPGPDAGTGEYLSVHSEGGYAGAAKAERLLASVLTARTRGELDEVSDLGLVYVGGVTSLFPDTGPR